MAVENVRNIVGAGVAVVAGAVTAAVTIIGLISSQVDSAGDNPVDADSATINYGATLPLAQGVRFDV